MSSLGTGVVDKDAILEFYFSEVSSSVAAHRTVAAERINQIAVVIGAERTRKELVPYIDSLLAEICCSDLATTNALACSIVQQKFLLSLAPAETLHLICKYLACHEESDVRKVGLQAMDSAIAVIPDADALATVFAAEFAQFLEGPDEVVRMPYLRIIGGIRFLGACYRAKRRILSVDEVERLLAPLSTASTPYVRAAIAENFIVLELSQTVGGNLLDDCSDLVVVTACRSGCLERVLSLCVGRRSFPVLVRKMTSHDSWKVRIEVAHALAIWLVSVPPGDDEASVASVGQALQQRVVAETELMVKRTLCETVAGSRRLLAHVNAGVLNEAIKSMEVKTDSDTRLSLARTHLSLYRVAQVTLDDLIARLETERDATVHHFLTDSIFSANFLGELDDATMEACFGKMYHALMNTGGSNVTCWRSIALVLERTGDVIALIGMDRWASSQATSAFVESCFIHPCAAVGQCCARVAICQVLETGGENWLRNDLLPMLGRLTLVWSTPRVQSNVMLACETVLNAVSNVTSDATQTLVLQVIVKALRDRTAAVRCKAAVLVQILAEARIIVSQDEDTRKELFDMLAQHVNNALESEHDIIVKRELDKALGKVSIN